MVAVILITATTAIAGIGFLHTPCVRNLPIGRKLLGLMGMKCPIDFSSLTSEQVEASRKMGVKLLSGRRFARARPTLPGLTLALTSEAEALIWARERNMDCVSEKRGMHFIKCERATGSLVPPQTLTLAFSPTDKLVAVDIFRRRLSSKDAAELMLSLSAELRRKIGSPTEARGGLTPGDFEGDIMRVSYVNYRFRDYLAMLTASRIPWSGGVMVHEQYSFVPQD